MSNKILSYKEDILKLKRGEMPVPKFVDLHLSYACNQACRGCAYINMKDGFIAPKDAAFSYIDQLIDYGARAFDIAGGGEPTMLPYLYGLIEHILARNCEYALITNGLNLNNQLIELVTKTATYIRISLEVGYPEGYSFYKNVPEEQFHRVVNNVKNILSHQLADTQLSLKFDVDNSQPDNEMNIFNSVQLTLELEVDRAIFKSITGKNELLLEEKERLADYLDRLIAPIRYNGVAFVNAIAYQKIVPQCWLNPLHTVIDAYGDVFICCYYYNERKDRHCLGNLNKKSFREIWESAEHFQKIKEIRKEECAKYDCKFFEHHRVIEEQFKRGRLDIL